MIRIVVVYASIAMRRSLAALALVLAVSAPAAAQMNQQPIPAVVFDARAALPLVGQDGVTAASLGVDPTSLPSVGLGVAVGAHVYPFRVAGIVVGFGGEFVRGSASNLPKDATGTATSAEILRTFESASGQFSLNFGHRLGWSYITGGAGPLRFDTHFAGVAVSPPRTTAINYGGGARWFVTPRLAFSLDLRFYRPSAIAASGGAAARNGRKITVFSIGVSVK
jgi:hypothetical protein